MPNSVPSGRHGRCTCTFTIEAEEVCACLQDAPPLTRNMPPVAGSIKWSRSLFARVKQTMQKLQDVEAELLQGETGQEVLPLSMPSSE